MHDVLHDNTGALHSDTANESCTQRGRKGHVDIRGVEKAGSRPLPLEVQTFTDVTGLSDVGLCKVEPCLKIASIWRWAQAKCTTPLCLAMGAAVADVKPLEVPGTRGHLSLRGTEIAKAKLVDCAPP